MSPIFKRQSHNTHDLFTLDSWFDADEVFPITVTRRTAAFGVRVQGTEKTKANTASLTGIDGIVLDLVPGRPALVHLRDRINVEVCTESSSPERFDVLSGPAA